MTAHHRDVPCSSLEDQIVSGLALTEEKRSHLEGCEACRRSSESLEAIAQAARGRGRAGPPPRGGGPARGGPGGARRGGGGGLAAGGGCTGVGV